MLMISGLVLYRLFVLSYVRHSAYSRTALAQRENINNVLARGNIYLKDALSGDLFLAATNRKFPLAYVVPSKVDWADNTGTIERAASVLEIEAASITKAVSGKQDVSKVLKRRLTAEDVDKIKNLNLKGLGISYEMDRFYPGQRLASNTIGFLGYDQEGRSGQYGIEAYYDDELFGSKMPGAFSNRHLNSEDFPRPSDIVLTLDKNIQDFIEDRLDNLIKTWNAEGGSIIVQDPQTGKILAMADKPSFDPNDYSDSPLSHFLNRSIQGVFEPGSSFKPITMAMGLDLAKVTPQTTFTDTGFVEISGYKINNFSEKVFGTQTMSQVLERSINTGAMFVQGLVGDDNFLNYIINMGFGQKTGVDLPGEVGGDITNLYSRRKINYLTASFGQGIAVTPLQLINAYSAIANGGKLMRPYVVEKIIKEGGVEEVAKPEVISIPISEKTSAKLKSMLVSVVDNGFDKARIKGYDIAGKTGTAQIPDGRGGYSENEYIHDFLGFAPAFDPKFVILIKMDKPKGITFAADSLSPTFRELAQFLINYFKIPPTRR
ncbi:MAG: penicillin-binding protein 2 [Candidatus Yanofskybacteria bacterium]|nr:penicillin-binding protein 2 [Candidatus Yanofskybacteria bacterium]